ncbi:MAG: glutathione peroxidase [Alphaproteobacteria bacterium]|nr:glutathione peroxidase [Alphaproteobacteria bacterium]
MSRFIAFSIAAALFVTSIAPALAEQTAAPAVATPAAPGAFGFHFFGIDGTEMPLSAYQGKVLLIVNTATGCGFAGHFRDLQKLHDTHGADGLVVIGVPSNDFGGQEPLDGDALKKAVADTYGATFPLTQKIAVSGGAAHPFYVWAGKQNVGGLLSSKPRWNFHKYLIGRDGRVLVSAGPTTGPLESGFLSSIKTALSQKTE